MGVNEKGSLLVSLDSSCCDQRYMPPFCCQCVEKEATKGHFLNPLIPDSSVGPLRELRGAI